MGTALGVGLLVAGSFLDGWGRAAVWSLALALDIGGPYLFGSEGWKLEPRHFAERHGLIILIALGESIVAVGVGAEVRLDAGIAAAAAFGIGLAAAHVVDLLRRRRPGRQPGGWSRPRSGACRTRWPATPIPTCTS